MSRKAYSLLSRHYNIKVSVFGRASAGIMTEELKIIVELTPRP
jgi:hypothetical protein